MKRGKNKKIKKIEHFLLDNSSECTMFNPISPLRLNEPGIGRPGGIIIRNTLETGNLHNYMLTKCLYGRHIFNWLVRNLKPNIFFILPTRRLGCNIKWNTPQPSIIN